MLELLLFVIILMLVLIYFQLRKNIKETDRFFAAIDSSLREFIAYISNLETANLEMRHKEICNHLENISTYSQKTASSLSKDENNFIHKVISENIDFS